MKLTVKGTTHVKTPIFYQISDARVHSGSVQAILHCLQLPAFPGTLRLLTQLSLCQAYLPQGYYEEKNNVWKGSGRQKQPVKPQLILMTLTVCDCEEQREIWGKGNREQDLNGKC